jgi:DnaJ-class molecular chaperone
MAIAISEVIGVFGRRRRQAERAAARAEAMRNLENIVNSDYYQEWMRQWSEADERARALGYESDQQMRLARQQQSRERQRPSCRKCGGSGMYNYGWMNPHSSSDTSMGTCPACGGRG